MKNKIIPFLLAPVALSVAQLCSAALLQSPVQVSSGTVSPNVMFTLDDSGSMQDVIDYDSYAYYLPWRKADGTRLPPANPTAAFDNPQSSDNGTTNVAGYITSGNRSYQAWEQGTKGAARIDCAGSVCTVAEERLNFANWYSYHSQRRKVAIAGTSEAFYTVPDDFRVGYGRINKGTNNSIDGFSVSTIQQGVRPFTTAAGGSKTAFYNWLHSTQASGVTPLRRAMDDVGQYFSYTDSRGPWGEMPGTATTSAPVACRRSFHVLMTDGGWNGEQSSTAASRANVDNVAGPVIPGINSQSYQYQPARPYRDNHDGTLADIAMYYWNRDLYPGLENAVRATPLDPAFWQHVSTYTIGLGISGTMDSETALPGLTSGSRSWPDPNRDSATEAQKIDDLWHAAVNSRGRYLNAMNTAEYGAALRSIINEISAVSGSEAGVAVSAKSISAASPVRKYEPTFASLNWSGDVEAVNINFAGENSGLAWKASQSLPLPAARRIFAGNPAAASQPKTVDFSWTSGLTTAMKTTLAGSSTAANGDAIVNYLRGDRTLETTTFRTRTSPLGDVVNSAPVMVKDQFDGQYDFGVVEAQKSVYRRFLNAKKLREGQLFVGMNDGMLHAFGDSNGQETFAYVPSSVLGNLSLLTAKDYQHRYFVDAPLVEADVYDTTASKWRNLVIGGTGAGAKSMFAINVPVAAWSAGAAAPTALTPAQSAPGASDLLWEITPASTGFAELGNVLSSAEHGVMLDGRWVVIFGNGYESTSKKAQLFIVDAVTGELVKKIDTGVGSATLPNGLGGVRVVRNTKKQIVAAYAGDQQGNLWKFDLSSDAPGNWEVAFGGSATARNPLYKTPLPEPITAAPTFVVHPSGGQMVMFGSGKLYETGDAVDPSPRAVYGVWDRVKLGLPSNLAADSVSDQSTIVSQAFVTAAITPAAGTFYSLLVTPVDYQSKRGWRLPLNLASGQRLIEDPEVSVGRVFMQTVSPVSTVTSCSGSNLIRHGIALDPFMNALEKPTFDTDGNGTIDSGDALLAVALQLNSNGPSSLVRKAGTNRSLLLSTGATGAQFEGINATTRRYWRQIVTTP